MAYSKQSEPKSSFIRRNSVKIELGNIDSKHIVLFAFESNEQFAGVTSEQAPRSFSAFIAIKDMPNLVEHSFKSRIMTITFRQFDSENNTKTYVFSSPFSAIIPAERKFLTDYYCYQIIYDELAPFPELNTVNQQIYIGSYSDRIKDILDIAGLSSDKFSLEIKNPINTKSLDTITTQLGQTYWEVLLELMQHGGIACFVNQEGKLVLTDSPKTYQDSPYGITTTGDLPKHIDRPFTRYIGLFQLRKPHSLNARQINVQAAPLPAPDKRLFIAKSRETHPLQQYYFVDNNSQDDTRHLADLYAQMENWSTETYTAKSYVLPPALGTKFKAQWETIDGKEHNAELAPWSIHFRVSFFRQFHDANKTFQDTDYPFLANWTGFEAEEMLTQLRLVNAEYLPLAQPFNYQQAQSKLVYGVVLDRSSLTNGDDANIKENQISIGLLPLIKEHATEKFMHVLANTVISGGVLPAAFAPGTIVLVSIDAFGHTLVLGRVREEKLTHNITLINGSSKEPKDNDNTAKISLTPNNIMALAANPKTMIEVNGDTIRLETGKDAKLSLTDNIEQSATDIDLKAKKSLKVDGPKIGVKGATTINTTNL